MYALYNREAMMISCNDTVRVLVTMVNIHALSATHLGVFMESVLYNRSYGYVKTVL